MLAVQAAELVVRQAESLGGPPLITVPAPLDPGRIVD